MGILEELLAQQELSQVKSPMAVPVDLQKRLGVEKVIQPNEVQSAGGMNAGNALAAAQVVAGLLGGIMQSKQASKDRKAKAASEAATRSGEITMRGAQLKNAALESLMRKL
jgi:hypothetical protein